MRKLKDAHVFSNEEGSIAKFLVSMGCYVAACFTADLISHDYLKKPFNWCGVLILYLCFAAVLTAIYFVARFLAYRTNIFPKAKYREAIHGVSFFILIILSIVLFIVLQ